MIKMNVAGLKGDPAYPKSFKFKQTLPIELVGEKLAKALINLVGIGGHPTVQFQQKINFKKVY